MEALTCFVPGGLRDETVEALAKYWLPNPVHLRLIDPKDPFAYARALNEFWCSGKDFVVVEPDVVIRADVTEAFTRCKEPYCCFPYAWKTDVGPALGCTRFRSSLTSRFPNAIQDILGSRISWRQLDVVLMRHTLARDNGIQPHVHVPPVDHLNPEKQLLPEASPEPLLAVPHW